MKICQLNEADGKLIAVAPMAKMKLLNTITDEQLVKHREQILNLLGSKVTKSELDLLIVVINDSAIDPEDLQAVMKIIAKYLTSLKMTIKRMKLVDIGGEIHASLPKLISSKKRGFDLTAELIVTCHNNKWQAIIEIEQINSITQIRSKKSDDENDVIGLVNSVINKLKKDWQVEFE